MAGDIGGKIFGGLFDIRMVGGRAWVRRLRERFEEMAITLSDYRVPLSKSLNEVLRPAIAKRFDTQGAGRWAKLAEGTKDKPSTVQMRTAPYSGRYRGQAPMGAGPKGPILRWTGRLKLAAMGGGTTGGQDGYATVDSHKLVMGAHASKGERTPGYYGNLHDLGKGGMKRRRIYNMPIWADDVVDVFDRWIYQEIVRPWARGA